MTRLNSVCSAQDLSKTVLPLNGFHLKLKKGSLPSSAGSGALVPKIAPALETDLGTGFCLDAQCRFIATNYHVAALARPRKIKGEEVIHWYFATGPEDDGATTNDIFSEKPMKYTLNRDFAILELRHPLSHYHGIPFNLDDPEIDQPVDIYAYPEEPLKLMRNLQQFHGAFKGRTTAGLLAFEYNFANGRAIRHGASGGLVVDSETQEIVGVLSRVGLGTNGHAVALALPVPFVADFVSKVQPWLAQSLFPSANKEAVSPASADLYPKLVPPPAADSLQHRSEEPVEVKMLRQKSQLLADTMRNFVAVQSFAWGSGDKPPVAFAEYEVKVLEGFQRFREYPGGKKELQNVPFPPVNTVVVPGGEWSELPQMVGTALRLKIHQAPDAVVNGHPIKVFQYRAESEDAVCIFKSVRDFGFFEASKTVSVPCYGEVWTDESLNILRASEHLQFSGEWRDYESVVTYGWLRRAGEADWVVPRTIFTQIRKGQKAYWCRGLFTNYRIFDVQAKIVASGHVQSLPQ
jgi:hypothetical protein